MADLSDGANWFETDASNNKGPPNGWPEGMMPSGVNDSARADKGALKRFWDKINPVQICTPSGGVYTFNTANPAYPTSYVYGEIYTFRPGLTSIGGDGFQVNALGVKPIWKYEPGGTWAPIFPEDMTISQDARLIYDGSLNGGSGAFILTNPFVPIYGDGTGGVRVPGALGVVGSMIAAGLVQSTFNGVGGGGVSIYASAGAIQSDVGGTALYLPNGDVSCQNIVTAGSSAGGVGSNVAILCNNGAVEVSRSGTAFYAPNGNVVCVSLTQSSDIRIKRDIWGYDAGLAEVTALRPITYCFNGRGGTVEDGRRHIGLIADEVEGVMPEMVGTMSRMLDPGDCAPSEIKTLDTTSLIFALVNCCKELASRITSLEADVRD
jgi:hypothetical protein